MREEDKEIIKDVINKMITQDNRATALPIYYQIEDEEEIPTSPDYADGWHWFYDCDTYSTEDAKEYLIGNVSEEDLDGDGSLEEKLENFGFEKVYYLTKKVYKRMFLTEESAKLHLKQNRYHYGPKARTYVFHAWRNSELKSFLEAVARSVGVEIEPK